VRPPNEWRVLYEKVREQESVQAFREWQKATFGDAGRIEGNRVEEINRDLLYRILIPAFRRNCLPKPEGNATCLVQSPTDGWWEGLNALCRVLGRAFASECVAKFGKNGSVDLDGWRKSHRINSRDIIGASGIEHAIPSDWTEDKNFIAGWLGAIQSPAGDRHYRAMYFLAAGWDADRIPVRYFTDEAALSWLNQTLKHPENQRFSLDVYRDDIRGKRKGLDLTPTAHRPQVVKVWGLSVVSVQSSAAKKHGIDLSALEKPLPYGSEFAVADWSEKRIEFI